MTFVDRLEADAGMGAIFFRYVHAFSLTHWHLSSLKPRKGSSMLRLGISGLPPCASELHTHLVFNKIKMNVCRDMINWHPFGLVSLLELPAYNKIPVLHVAMSPCRLRTLLYRAESLSRCVTVEVFYRPRKRLDELIRITAWDVDMQHRQKATLRQMSLIFSCNRSRKKKGPMLYLWI